MKKLILAFQILALTLVFAVPVMAETKVPKELCMELYQGASHLANMELAIKKGAKLKYSNIKSTFYSIQGTFTNLVAIPSSPCDGSGYVNVTSFPTPVFAATLQCVSQSGPLLGGLGWTIEDGGNRILTLNDLTNLSEVFTAVEVDCKSAIQQ